jgi:branched-subunit amino acid transport protein
MTGLAILIAAGVLTYALRCSMVHVLHGRALSARWSMAFAGAIPAGLAAIIVVPLAAHAGHELAPRAAAVVVAAVVTRFTNRVSVVIGAGMATFWVLATRVP